MMANEERIKQIVDQMLRMPVFSEEVEESLEDIRETVNADDALMATYTDLATALLVHVQGRPLTAALAAVACTFETLLEQWYDELEDE